MASADFSASRGSQLTPLNNTVMNRYTELQERIDDLTRAMNILERERDELVLEQGNLPGDDKKIDF
ncbi:MAG: hypothetical protein KGL39_57645 [Patescibacteria group bacterium]|nr:hypothetical protein [Patescibacteria group bacterium]